MENDGKNLEDLIKGEEINTSKGPCYQIKNTSKIMFNTLSPKIAKEKILNDLKVLKVIGIARELKLKDEGYKT